MNQFVAAVVVLVLSTCAAQAQSPDDDNRAIEAYNAGVELLSKDQYAAALDKFKDAARYKPSLVEAYFNQGTALIKLHRFDEALPLLAKVVEMRPDSAEGFLQKGVCLEHIGRLPEAKEAFERYVQLKPNAENAEQMRSHIALLQRECNRTQIKVSANAAHYLEETAQNGVARWPKNRMPLKIVINDGSQIPHYRPEYANLVRQGFLDWCTGSQGKVSCTFITDPAQADIEVVWTDNPDELTTPQEGGHAQMTAFHSRLERGKIVLLTTMTDGRVLSEKPLRRISLHEIGHALGMIGHSSSPGDVMYAVGGPETEGELSKRDLNTLVALYSADDAFLSKHQITAALVTDSGDSSSPVVKALNLNSEGIDALNKNDLALAKSKFEESLKLKPGDAASENNLGIVLAKQYAAAVKQGKNKEAAALLKAAIELFDHARNIKALKSSLTNYARLSDFLGDKTEAQKARARLAQLK